MLNENKYIPDYSLKHKQIIVSKKYFERYISTYGKDKLEKYSYLFLKFLRKFQKSFPYPDCYENLKEVIDKVSKIDISKTYDDINKTFKYSLYTYGHNYLKSHFKSYWGSRFKGNLSPLEAWESEKVMSDIIKYRIGINNSDEVFDMSLHQIIRGISARRISVSFFSPSLAYSIYKVLLKDINNIEPIVLDPCCGFGARLLGFKSAYPNGKYVGCEPNVETYNELQELVKSAGWSNVKIYNCKFEDFNNDDNDIFDLVFTSIPYFDIEEYSHNTVYKSFEEWTSKFIGKFKEYSKFNCYINLPSNLADQLELTNVAYKINKNTSHFNKNNTNKSEYIVKL